MGRRLLDRRMQLVMQYVDPRSLVDIGIGSGNFVQAADCLGYDVGEPMVRWLHDNARFLDPYGGHVENVSCWDSLEHMRYPEELLARVRGYVFVSIPIFESKEHVLRSKHYKTDEHFWYFTSDGFRLWMQMQGFVCVEVNRMEEECGREDIRTFVFKRRSQTQ